MGFQQKQKGLSVLEMIVVIVIIGIIAAIAIPWLLSSRKSTNESAIVATLQKVHVAETTYYTVIGANTNYGTFSDLSDQKMLDSTFTGTSVSNHQYTIALSVVTGKYCIKASPQTASAGTKYFGISQQGIVYQSTVSADIDCTNGILTTGGGATRVVQ